MNMKRSGLLLSLGCILTLGLSAQKSWEGTAAAGRYGEFPPMGYFGTSNSFPRNSIVDVLNIANGKSVRLIITGELSDPSLFMVISEEAAEAVGLDRRDTARVRVTAVVVPGSAAAAGAYDLPYSDDPEINPAARAGDVNEGVEKRSAPAKAPVIAAASTVVPAEVPAAAPPEVADTAPEMKTLSAEPAVPAEPAPPAGPTPVLPAASAAAVEIPPPAEPTVPEKPETSIAAASAEDQPLGEPAEPKHPGDESDSSPAETITAREPEDAAPVPAEPEPAISGEGKTESVEKLDTIIASIPDSGAEPPPSGDAASVPEPTPTAVETARPAADEGGPADVWARSNLPLVGSLASRAYYLQVASFANPRGAKPVVDALSANYPVVVHSAGGTKPLYRVLVGPVREDERGLILHTLRSGGYRDAFMRRGE